MAVAAIVATLVNSAQATTFYYFRGGATAQTTAPTPPAPNSTGTFAILVDGPSVAIRGETYTATTYTYNNVGPVTYSVQSGSLPPGITLNSSTGSITGSPTINGQTQATIQATDAATNGTATASLTIDVVDPFSISGNPGTTVAVNTPYSTSFFLSGGSTPYNMTASGLPPGLTFNFAAGNAQATLAGSPTSPGSYGVTVTGQDANGLTAAYPFTLNVMGALAVNGTPPATGNVGSPYSGGVSASGGSNTGYTYALAAGSLPAGITLKSATGVISGTPTLVQTKTGIRIKVTDSAGATATSAPFSITISAALPLAISGAPASTVEEGSTYYSQWTSSGGAAPYAFSLTGSLPAGLGWDAANARISGVPGSGSAGSYPLTIKVTDSASHTASASYTLIVTAPAAPPALTLAGSPATVAHLDESYSAQFTASGGTGSYLYAVSSGALPPGISLDPFSGALSGTPTTLGNYPNIVVRVTDSSNTAVASSPFSINVTDGAPLTISWAPKTSWTIGDTFNTTVSTVGGSHPLSYSVSGTLPPGVALNRSNGELLGQLTQAGSFGPITISATDGVRSATTAPITFNVAWTAIAVSGTAPSTIDEGMPYSAQFTASGGSGSFIWSLASGTLPAGLTLDPSSGLLSGSPSTGSNGTYANLSVTATDIASGSSGQSAAFSIQVFKPLTISSNPATFIVVGTPYSVNFFLSGGHSPYTFVESGAPAGLSFSAASATDTLSGIATVPGTYPITVTGKDSGGAQVAYSYTLTVAPKLVVSGNPPATTMLGDSYSAQFSATGGIGAPYTYSIASGSLPPGLTLDPNSGLLSGVSTTAGIYSGIAVGVTDVGGLTASSAAFSIEVDAPSIGLSIAWAGSPNLQFAEGDSMVTPVIVTGGSGNFSFSYSGTLPDGVWQNEDSSSGALSGALTGTMAPAGNYGPIRVTVLDNVSGQTATTTAITFTVTAPYVPAITVAGPYVPGSSDTSTLPANPIGGAAYQAQLTASGGNGGPYTYSFSVGSAGLPPGLTMDPSTGLISGVLGASASGWYGNYQVIATDSARNFGLSQWFSFWVNEGLGIDLANNVAVGEGKPWQFFYRANDGSTYANFPPGAFGGDNNYTYTLTGTLPDGLTYSTSDGTISGTPAVGTAGTYKNLVYTVQDGTGVTVTSNSFTLTVDPLPPLQVSYGSFSNPTYVGNNFQTYVSASGGDGGPYTWTVTAREAGGALPTGFTFSGTTLSATTSNANAGTWTFDVVATDQHSHSASTSFQVVIDFQPLQISGGATVTANPGDNIQSVMSRFGYTFSVFGGSGGNTFQVVSSSLPPGVSLDPVAGVLSGNIDAAASGLYGGIVVQVTDSFNHTAKALPFDIFVPTPGPLMISGNPPTKAYAGDFYDTHFYAAGGTAPYAFSIVSQPDSNRFQINASTGELTAALPGGVYPGLQVKVTDSANNEVLSQVWTVTVEDGIKLTVPSPITGKVGQPITPVTAVVTGGSGTGYQFSMWDFSAALPAGLTLDKNSGVISGTVQAATDYSSYRAQVFDSEGHWASSNQFQITITADLKLTGTPPADTFVGSDYEATQPTVSGGSNQPWIYTYALVSGTLPPGLTMGSRNGHISGTPTTIGTYPNLQIQVTDPSTGETALSEVFTITVHAGKQQPVTAWFQTPGFTNGSPSGMMGVNQRIQTITAAANTTTQVQAAAAGGSGTGHYNWTVTPGYSNPNMSVSATGLVSVTYQTPGTYSISLRATDPVTGIYGDTNPLTVYVAALSVRVGGDADVFDGESVNIPIEISGGTGPYTVTKGGGTVPGGIGITPNAIIGSPQGQGGSGGVYMFSVFVTDANGVTADSGVVTIGVKHRSTCLFVGIGPFGIAGNGAADAGSGVRDDYDGYDAIFIFWLEPGGYTMTDMNSDGVGVKQADFTAWGDYPLTSQYSQHSCDRIGVSVNFVNQVNLITPGSVSGVAGAALVTKLYAVGGKPDGGYWYTARGLPAGLKIDERTGSITGIVSSTASGLYQVVVSAMDSYGITDQSTMQIVIVPGG